MRVLVSACLLGERCRYDGGESRAGSVIEEVEEIRQAGGSVHAICPEVLGGLSTPRAAAELRGGDGAAVWLGKARVETLKDGEDVTHAFCHGARRAAAIAADRAILKARSPSCGCGNTHIDGEVRAGDGVFAALLRQRGVAVETDEALAERRRRSIHGG